MHKFLNIFIFVLLTGTSIAQESNDDKAFKKGQKLFYQERFEEALVEFGSNLQIEDLTSMAAYQMEICSLLTNYRNKSLDTILKFKYSFGQTDKFYYYWMGRIYFRRYNFSKAIESWDRFLALEVYKSNFIIGETQVYLNWAEEAKQFYRKVDHYRIEHLEDGINTKGAEFSPVFFENTSELLFLSDRGSKNELENIRIYKSYKTEDRWSRPVVLPKFGLFDRKNPDIEYVSNEQQIYFFKGEYKVDMYFSDRTQNDWTEPLEFLEKIPISRLESHFYINGNQDLILFSVRKKVKPFDFDLFKTTKNPSSGKWTKPELFSLNINSDQDENYPYMTSDGKTLYFSSRGFEAIGGYDIFKSEFDESTEKWSHPIHFNYPVNTIDDEIQYRVDKGVDHGYFISDRYGTVGGYDIFYFNKSYSLLLVIDVKDKNGRDAKNINVEITSSTYNQKVTNINTGEYGKVEVIIGSGQSLKLDFYQNDHLLLEEIIRAPYADKEDMVMTKSFALDLDHVELKEIETSNRFVEPEYEDLESIGSKFRKSNKALIEHIYFDIDEYHLDFGERGKLDPLVETMKENPSVKVEIAGHTDNRGDRSYNQRISQLRANSVALYLIEQGIEPSRMVTKGYGETRPIATNDDEKDGRELNRRIEVVVIE